MGNLKLQELSYERGLQFAFCKNNANSYSEIARDFSTEQINYKEMALKHWLKRPTRLIGNSRETVRYYKKLMVSKAL